MNDTEQARIRDLILANVPEDGKKVGNVSLFREVKKALKAENLDYDEDAVSAAREQLIAEGTLGKGRGRGGAVYRIKVTDFDLSTQQATVEKPAVKKKAVKKEGTRKKRGEATEVLSYRYDDKRTNNPHVGMVDTHSDGVEEPKTWAYDPHIDPALNFDSSRAQVESLIDNALASGNAVQMQAALEQLKRMQSPYLNWSGKAEHTSFEIDTVSLHVHERLDPATILAAVQKRIKDSESKTGAAFQPDLFHAPFENLPLREAIDFYKHERDWANRLIAGDSLLVMNSMLQKESMAGHVQMIYIDPPYGIKYGSNFQPFTNQKQVKETDQDLTQEPEMIKAFRDTWELGIHSYLTYLRDRLLLSKELLHESGSVFVQISDDNLHHVREILDEVFGAQNFCGLIPFRKKTMPLGSQTIEQMHDFIVWYAKQLKTSSGKLNAKINKLFKEYDVEGSRHWSWVLESNGVARQMNKEEHSNHAILKGDARVFRVKNPEPMGDTEEYKYPHEFEGRRYPAPSKGWGVSPRKMTALCGAGRVQEEGNRLVFRLFFDDYPVTALTVPWNDTVGPQGKTYVVQTSEKVIERCMLMTTDPADLVLDPTCGSGTTAFVAEKWGRRWITTDTSRVAVTLAKQRLMTASYNYFELKYPQEGLHGGFIYKTVPHVTLKSIANNPEIDEIYERMHPEIETALAALNKAAKKTLQEWEVPFDFPDNWLENARKPFDSFHVAREAMQKQMDDSIAAHAGREVLYDQPIASKSKLRITGPFTVEAVPFATVLGLDEAEQPKEADVAVARSGATARQSQWRDELLKAGIRGKGGQKVQLLDLAPLPGSKYVHAIGTVKETGDKVAVSFGPQHAAMEQRQVEIAMREAGELFPLPKMLVFCAFTFDPEAAKDIDNIKGITALKVQMNTDLLTEDLKKGRASNESFWLMGQPDVSVKQLEDGQYQVEVKGFDYFDTKSGELRSGGKKNIAMWELDTDYDNRSLFPRQVFFPMAGNKDGWNKLQKDIRAELNEGLLDKFHGTLSLPFVAGENECIAVKIVDDRGIESLKVINLDKVS